MVGMKVNIIKPTGKFIKTELREINKPELNIKILIVRGKHDLMELKKPDNFFEMMLAMIIELINLIE
jgi:hypothetical protein